MNVLSIGNSFSCDAQRYLHRIAKEDGEGLYTVNLFIGGCPLSLHYENMLNGESAYELEVNGESTCSVISLKDALLSREWSVVTLQQVSHQSPYYHTYQPYLNSLAKFVRENAPQAKIVVHQTWAYEEDSYRLNTELGYTNHKDMFENVKSSYKKAAEEINADFLIPSGELFEKLLENGINKVHRDTFHASFGLGRYALGLLWYVFLTGKNIENNKFCDFDEEIPQNEIKIAKKCVEEVYKNYL